jgi:L-serine dehydratase
MRAAVQFAAGLTDRGILDDVARVQGELYGSLALTGVGHATDRAILLGLAGNEPATIAPESIDATIASIRAKREINLGGRRSIPFDEASDLIFHREIMFPPNSIMQHPNGLRLTAFDAAKKVLDQRTFFSIGGGFITEDSPNSGAAGLAGQDDVRIPYPFRSAAELIEQARTKQISISQLMLANEAARLGGLSGAEAERRVLERIDLIWQIMSDCIDRGVTTEGTLPGGLNVRRRAHRLAERLMEKEASGKPSDPLAPLDWVTVWAMAVNEENAAGGRVVTAPTNGAAGVIPAVARYFERFIPGADGDGMHRFFLTSAAIGILYKENASISGAEVGCQGEVGVACSMAAGGLTAALGGTNGQIEHAAEIAMEHNLGMTCDPIGGLVQIPCIERNAMGAVKAVQASRIAMNETEAHKVSLDQVIRTMYLTGMDMQSRYKETSLAGLALNIIEC